MITVVLIKNPFEPDRGREAHQVPFVPGKRAVSYVDEFAKDYTGYFVRDTSKLVDIDHVPADGSLLVVTPVVGKSRFLGMILSIGLSIVAFGAGGLVATGSWGGLAAATGWSAVAGYLTAAAVMMIGGSLIQRSFGTANIGSKDASVDPTYSWDGQTTTTGQGAYIPITYGTVMSGGQVISEYVNTEGNKQYLYRLYSAGEGPIEIHDVLINDNPASQYENIFIDTREGTNDQAVIDGFNKSVSQKGLGYELSDSVWRSEIVTGTATEGIMLSLEASNGLYHQNDQGDLENASVTMAAQYRKRGTETWHNLGLQKSVSANGTGVEISLISQEVEPGTYTVTSKRVYGTYVERGVTHENPEDYRGIQVMIGQYSSSGLLVTGNASASQMETAKYLQCGPFRVHVEGHTAKDSPLITGSLTVASAGENLTMSGKSTTAIRQNFSIEHIDPGEYEVQVKIVKYSHDKNSVRNSLRIFWTAVSGIVYEDFIYPGIGLMAMKGMATDQLSGSPTIKFLKTRKTIWAWNPHKLTYEEKPADNPAWAAYDYIHQAYQIKDVHTGEMVMDVRGADKDLMLYDRFDRWAAFCESRGLKINIELSQPDNLLTTINRDIAPVGYGCVLLYGTKYGPVWDAPSLPVQLFGMGNIVSGTYQEEFLATNDRANAIEVTFTNSQKNYERDTVTVYGKSYDQDTGKTTQVTMNGITNYDQAYRYGMFQLLCNERLVRTVSFEADIDAIACTVGDVVYISHDIPTWAVSGRVARVNGMAVSFYAVFDHYDAEKAYQMTFRSSKDDKLYTVKCSVAVTDTMVTATMTETPQVMPAAGDVCAVASVATGCKPFTIKAITRSNTGNSMRRKLTCLEYDAAVFGEQYDVPPIEYGDQTVTVEGPTNLTVKASLSLSGDGKGTYTLIASWVNPKKLVTIHFLVSEDGGKTFQQLALLSHGETEYSFQGKANVNYTIRLYGTNEIGMESDFIQAAASISGLLAPAPKPTGLMAYTRYRQREDGTHVYDIAVSWKGGMTGGVYYKSNYSQAVDIVIKEGIPADELGFEGPWTFAGYGKGQVIISGAIPGDTYKIAVTTANALGTYTLPDNSPQVTVVAALKTMVPNTPDGLSVIFSNVAAVSWNAVTNTDISGYELRSNSSIGQASGLLSWTNSLSVNAPLTERSGTLYLYAVGTDGKYSSPAVLKYNKSLPPAPKAPTLAAKLGGIAVTVGSIPAGCNGMTAYINGPKSQSVHTVNTTLTYMCDAGMYDVTCAYTDLFGEGPQSPASRIAIKAKVDQNLLEDGAVSLKKVDDTVKNAIQDAGDQAADAKNTVAELSKKTDSLQNEVTGVKKDMTGLTSTVNANTGSITELQQTTAQIQSTVTANKNAQDTENQKLASQITQTAGDISTVVANLNKNPEESPYQSITSIHQTTESITSSVEQAVDDVNSVKSEIKQNADQITSIVTNLNSADPSKSPYSAITQLQNAINLRVKNGDVLTQLNLSPAGATIDGRLLHVTGDTLIDGNLITQKMIQAGAITADKLAAQDITIGGTNTTTGIVGGAVRLDQNGLTVTKENGEAVKFTKDGMLFVDTNGTPYVGIGRICTGVANDGDVIQFTKAWDVIPHVIIIPMKFQTGMQEYQSINIYQDFRATDVSEEGFGVICRSILQSGSGGSVVLNKKFADKKGNNSETFEIGITWPDTATQVTVTLFLTAYGDAGYDYVSESYDGYAGTMTGAVQWVVNGVAEAEQTAIYAKGSYTDNGSWDPPVIYPDNETKTLSRTFNVSKGSKLSVRVRFWGGGDALNSNAGTATLQSCSYNVSGDVTISRGTAAFIAMDPNTIAYTVQNGGES